MRGYGTRTVGKEGRIDGREAAGEVWEYLASEGWLLHHAIFAHLSQSHCETQSTTIS